MPNIFAFLVILQITRVFANSIAFLSLEFVDHSEITNATFINDILNKSPASQCKLAITDAQFVNVQSRVTAIYLGLLYDIGDACLPLQEPPKYGNISSYMYLIDLNSTCTFSTQLANVDNRTYVGGVLFYGKDDVREPIAPELQSRNLSYPVSYITRSDGRQLRQLMKYVNRTETDKAALDTLCRTSPPSSIFQSFSVDTAAFFDPRLAVKVSFNINIDQPQSVDSVMKLALISIGIFLAIVIPIYVYIHLRHLKRLAELRENAIELEAMRPPPQPPKILTMEELMAFPVTKYEADKGAESACTICLENFVEEEDVRMLPCAHTFHLGCIDTWLTKKSGTCPCCREDYKPE